MKSINKFLTEEFIFSPRYKGWRHIIYWLFHISAWSLFWMIMGTPTSFGRTFFNMLLWMPVFILYGYPLAYYAVPNLLLKEKMWQFFLVILVWGVAGLYINTGFRTYVYVPIQVAMNFDYIPPKGPQAHSYLCMTTSAASPMIINFFKLWSLKQKEWLQVQQERITAELQLLKAQIHPHFLFNTLNNIYSFSLENSPKTPQLIQKLTSLLNYMLNDCDAVDVKLKKEIEIMRNYIDLEKERYGNKIEITWNVEGNIEEARIAPLLLLPFLENAFKHGTSEQMERPWLGVDISLNHGELRCEIANSKNDIVKSGNKGIGINNVQKRLQLIYPGRHELKIKDEGDMFVVSMSIKIAAGAAVNMRPARSAVIKQSIPA